MKLGNLRNRVILQQLIRTDDGAGGYIETWNAVATVWADVYPLKGNERYEAQKVQANLSHRVTIRHHTDVKPSMRLQYGTRMLSIEAVIDTEERHRELVLMCAEVV